MECLEKPIWKTLKVEQPDAVIEQQIRKNWDQIAKPIDGLGKFEEVIAKIGAIQRTTVPDLRKKAILIFCADNGVVEEGISQSGQEVTTMVMKNMAKQSSSVGKMARCCGIETIPIDIGVNTNEIIDGVLERKIRLGTRNFFQEPAMTEEETLQAISTGIKLVEECKKQGYTLLGTGEMGIGNTTTSSAVASALLSSEVHEMTGRGAGLNDSKLERKYQVIQEALDHYGLWEADSFRILQTVGGLDLAGLVGMCMGGALYHIPIVLDGVISLAAALTAERLLPGTKDYLFGSHRGKEPAMERLWKALALDPVIDGNLALGEGTGAVMMMGLLDMAYTVYTTGTRFSEIELEPYKRG